MKLEFKVNFIPLPSVVCVNKVFWMFPADVTIPDNCSSYRAVAGKGSDTETWLGAYWDRDKVDWWPPFLPMSWHHVHILPFLQGLLAHN